MPSDAAAGRPSSAVPRQMIETRSTLTSSMGTTAAQGVALGTKLHVSDRPVTQQGMRGMKTAQGPSRQVQDSSYYVGILRTKVIELTNEIHSMQAENKQHERSMQDYGSLQKRHEDILNAVRTLEGTLADYNLAMDKARISTDPVELDEIVSEFRSKNRKFAGEVDRIFLIKKQKKDDTTQIDAKIQELHSLAQRKISDLDPQKLNHYNDLQNQSLELQGKQNAALMEVEGGLISQIHDGLEGLHEESFSHEYLRLSKFGERLKRNESQLIDELAMWELADPKETLAKLKSQVEAQSSELKHYEGYARDLQDQIAAAREQLSEVNEELKDHKTNPEDQQHKYEKLRQRDEEMSKFISEFEATRVSTVQDQKLTEGSIVSLLEHVSQTLEQQNSMPTEQRLREMRVEATFKERQLESSQQTTHKLIQERRQRETELQKIQSLDEKIKIELSSLQQKMKMMQSDMIEFDNIDGLRQRAAATLSTLSRFIREYQGRRESVRSQVVHLTSKYEALKGKIQASESARNLSVLEAKIRSYGQTIFHLQDFVETKSRETDYKFLKESTFTLLSNMNRNAKTAAVSGS